jgi:beta-galactosidase
MLQWEHMHGFDDKALVDGKQAYREVRDIAPPFAPGRRGAYVRQASLVQQFYFTPLGAATRRGGEYNALACGPALAYIAGKAVAGDAMAFTAKDHHFTGGEWVEKRLLAQNDSRRALGVDLEWQALVGGKIISSGRVQSNLDVSAALWHAFRFQAPEVAGKTEGEIRLSGVMGTHRLRDVFSFRVFPAPKKASGEISVWDPEGSSSRVLTDAGFTVKRWDGRASPGILAVGRQAFSKGRTPPGSLESYAKAGGRLLVFSQDRAWLTGPAGLRVGHQVSRQVYPVSSNHPVAAGLDGEDLRDWTCRGTLLPERESPPVQASSSFPFHGWRWGNRGSVASIPVEKPHGGGWRPILECDFDLSFTPLMELDYGKGRVTLCQLDLEDAGSDAVARLLTSRVVDWAARAPVSTPHAVAYIGGPAGASMLEGISAVFSKANALPQEAGVLVVGEDAPVSDAQLETHLTRGGRVVLLPMALPRLGFKTQALTLEGAQSVPGWPECEGLSLSDLRLRVPTPCQALAGDSARGIDAGAGGLLARRRLGKGYAIAMGFNPEALGAHEKTYLRLTRWRQYRAWVQVLANAGVRFATAGKIFGRDETAQSGLQPLMLAGNWLGAQTRAIPETPDGQTPPEDPGLSEKASAFLRQGPTKENAPSLQSIRFPGTMEETGGSWARFDGEAVFFKIVSVPEAWAGKDLELSLGVVDDFDDTFWDGQKIGSTGKTQKEWWKHPRRYKIPGALVKAGSHVIAVRLFDNFREGGILGPAAEMKLDLMRAPQGLAGWYHADYRSDYALGDDPHRYYRW